MAAAGSAVGLGNIWRFPYLTGENGGGAFLLVYIVCVLLVGLPVMLSEFVIGRRSGKNALGAIRALSGSRRWDWLGWSCVACSVLILAFYVVVTTAVTVVLAVACSLSLDGVFQIAGRSLFDWFDFLTSKFLMPLGGMGFVLFLGWSYPSEGSRDELQQGSFMCAGFSSAGCGRYAYLCLSLSSSSSCMGWG